MQEVAYQHSRCENHRKRIYTYIEFMHTFLTNRYFSLPIYSIIHKLHVFHIALQTMLLKQRVTKKKILRNISLTYFQLLFHHKICLK